MASAGLLWAAAIPLARETATDPLTLGIVAISLAVLLTRKVESLWVILASGLLELTAVSFHLAGGAARSTALLH
jgi:chromate transporter